MTDVSMTGGDKLTARLAQIAQNVSGKTELRVGFLEGATYPKGGVNVATVAFLQDRGAPAAGIPPRPFFRNAVAQGKDHWGDDLERSLKANDFDAERAMGQMGEQIKDEIQASIIATNAPPLKPATIKRKGFAKPLIDTRHMLHSVDYNVNRT